MGYGACSRSPLPSFVLTEGSGCVERIGRHFLCCSQRRCKSIKAHGIRACFIRSSCSSQCSHCCCLLGFRAGCSAGFYIGNPSFWLLLPPPHVGSSCAVCCCACRSVGRLTLQLG